MNFVFSLIALFSWTGSDLLSKLGTQQKDKNSHWHVIFFVGLIMGIHALITIVISPLINVETFPSWLLPVFYTDFKPIDFITYLPVAFIYLLAMVIGYIGLRYIELSISSPICNSSGSLALLICIILGWAKLETSTIIAVILITIGIISLGIFEYTEDEEIKFARQNEGSFKYTKSIVAIIIPILYLFIDALGTVGDQMVCELNLFDSDYAPNTAFELTSVLFAITAFIVIKFIKKEKIINFANKESIKSSRFLLFGGIAETLGQIFYMSVMLSDFDAGMPMISSYCVLSFILSRYILKEKLSLKHYISICLTLIGIIILGIYSPI